jgi:SAM-dependent methyltransferase
MNSATARYHARNLIRTASAILYSGGEFYCPCCQRQLRRFVSSIAGPQTACPACGSFQRQRLLMLYLTERTDVLVSPLRMLHFAPEKCLYDRFRATPGLDYVTADLLDLPMVDVTVDITNMQFDSESFDVIVCSHVLEHVIDDGAAMREMRRILRPSGRAILQHPIDHALAQTYEDESIIDPQERAQAFEQSDHVRIYGPDFVDRLQAAGFTVGYVPYRDQVSAEQVRRSALEDTNRKRADDLYICTP